MSEEHTNDEQLINELNATEDLSNIDTSKLSKEEKAELRLKKLDIFLSVKRTEWKNRIKGLAEDLRDIKNITEITVFVSSYRAMLIENVADIAVKVRQRWSSYNVNYKLKYHSYMRYDFKLTDKRIDLMIQADLRYKLEEIGLLEVQLEFYKEAVKTLDQMTWGVKNRLQAENIM
jgi:hypothetical protein